MLLLIFESTTNYREKKQKPKTKKNNQEYHLRRESGRERGALGGAGLDGNAGRDRRDGQAPLAPRGRRRGERGAGTNQGREKDGIFHAFKKNKTKKKKKVENFLVWLFFSLHPQGF
jgi:hypothetical protein